MSVCFVFSMSTPLLVNTCNSKWFSCLEMSEGAAARVCVSSTRSDDCNSRPFSSGLPADFPTSHTEKLPWLHWTVQRWSHFTIFVPGRQGRVKSNDSSCGFNLHFLDYEWGCFTFSSIQFFLFIKCLFKSTFWWHFPVLADFWELPVDTMCGLFLSPTPWVVFLLFVFA